MNPALEAYLKNNKIEYTEHKHPAVFTVEESKNLKGKIPGLHCKSLFLKSPDKFYLICLPALKRLDMKSLKVKLETKKLSFASPEELMEKLSLTPGSVSLFGMINASDVTLILDKEVWDSDLVGFHPNINTSTLVVNHKNLEMFYNSLDAEKSIIDL